MQGLVLYSYADMLAFVMVFNIHFVNTGEQKVLCATRDIMSMIACGTFIKLEPAHHRRRQQLNRIIETCSKADVCRGY